MPIKVNVAPQRVSPGGFRAGGPAHASPDAYGAQAAKGQMALGDASRRFGMQVADAGTKIVNALDARELRRQSTKALENLSALQDEFRQFDNDYRTKNYGENAENAIGDYTAKMDELIGKHRQGITDERALNDFDAKALHLRAGAINTGASWRQHQDEAWRKDTLNARGVRVFSMAADPNVSADEAGAAFTEYQREVAALWPGPRDAQIAADQEKFKHSRWQAGLGWALSVPPEQALAIVREGGGPNVGNLEPGLVSMADAAAAKHGVDPALVKAVMWQESRGDKSAVSPAGARGLMQLMPDTAKELGVNQDDPAQNIDGGVRYLKRMLDKYGGDTKLALAAYNWGPGNVDSFLKTGKGMNGQDMPGETREYAGKILGDGGHSPGLKYGTPQQRAALARHLESELKRQEAEKTATEADDMALSFLERVKNGEDYDTVHKDVLALPHQQRGPVNNLFQAHHRDWHNANVLKTQDGIIANREKMEGMPIGEAYKFAHGLPENTWTERQVKKQALADYRVASSHAGLHGMTDPDTYSKLVDAIAYGDVKGEKELRAHELAVKVSKPDMDKLAKDLHGASVIPEKELKTAYRWAIGRKEDDPNGGTLDAKDKADFLKFSAWAAKQAEGSNKAKEPGYAQELARQWRMHGETPSKSGLKWGYGRDVPFRDALNDSQWLPDLEGTILHNGEEVDAGELVNSVFAANPEVAAQWKAKHNNDIQLAKRDYLKLLMELNRMPRQREVMK